MCKRLGQGRAKTKAGTIRRGKVLKTVNDSDAFVGPATRSVPGREIRGEFDLPMTSQARSRRLRMVAATALAMVLAACASKPLPPPPPPPPPLIEVPPPPEPTPPDGAAPTLVTPEIGADGQRESVNRKVSTNQMVWNLRSAYTVAALDCLDPRNAQILTNYRSFLVRNAGALKSVYDGMDHEFREKYQRGGEKLRDDYLTVLYNHYALPPTKAEFCNVVDQVLQDGIAVPADQLGMFATAKVPLIEKVFDDFYTRYDQYKNALAAWQEKYGKVGHVSVGHFGLQTPPPPPPPVAPFHNQVDGPARYPATVDQVPASEAAAPPASQAPAAQGPATQGPVYQAPPEQMPAPYQPPVQAAVQAPVQNLAQPIPKSEPATPPAQSGHLPDLLSGPHDEPVATPPATPPAPPAAEPPAPTPAAPAAGPPNQ